ncbi:MAG: hypothetical protein AAGA96_02755 [Verrucomicrobiota bacterium]
MSFRATAAAGPTDGRDMEQGTSRQPPALQTEGSKELNSGQGWRVGLKAFARSLGLSALLLGPGMLFLMMGEKGLGMTWLFLASFAMMAWTYRKPWRVTALSCLIPPAITALSFLLQLALLNRTLPSPLLLLLVLAGGFWFGWMRARVHRIHLERDDSIVAQRTMGYLAVWVGSYVVTQLLAFASAETMLVKGAMLTAVFSAAMVGTFTLFLFFRSQSLRSSQSNAVAAVIIFLVLSGIPFSSEAQQRVDTRTLVDRIFLMNDISLGYGQETSITDTQSGHIKTFKHTNREQVVGDPLNYVDRVTTASVVLREGANAAQAKQGFDETVHWIQSSMRIPISATGRNLGDESILAAGNSSPDVCNVNVVFRYDRYVVNVTFLQIAPIYPTGYRLTDPNSISGSVLSAAERVYARLAREVANMNQAAQPVPARSTPAHPEGTSTPSRTPTPTTSTPPQGPSTTTSRPPNAISRTSSDGLVNADAAALVAMLIAILMAAGGISLNVAQAIAQAALDATHAAGDSETEDTRSKTPPDLDRREGPLKDADGTPIIQQDGSYEEGRPGQYWMDERWVDREEAEALIREREREVDQRRSEIESFLQENERLFQERQLFNEQEAIRNQRLREAEQREQEAKEAFEARRRERIATRLQEAAEKSGDESWQVMIDGLIEEGEHDTLFDLYREELESQWGQSIRDAAEARDDAWRNGAIADTAALVKTGAQGAIMSLGGPAGFAPTILASGAIGSASEGSEAYFNGKQPAEILASSAAGFLSGAKDAGTNAISRLPGVGWAGRNLLPAAADTLETFVRTGDASTSLKTGAINLISGAASEKTDLINNRFGREGAELLTTAVTSGSTSVVNGGSFGEGATDGLMHHVAGKVGATSGEAAAGFTSVRGDPVPDETRVREALEAGKAESRTAEQGPITQELQRTQDDEPVIGRNGKPLINPRTGKPVTESFVDTKVALQQLANPAESRTAKGANSDFVQAVIRTRNERIYEPANRATIDAVTPRLEQAGLLQPGDRLVMDTFSTPGSSPTLGADRDARLVIERTVEGGKTELIEVPRAHWERQAQADFAAHTRPLAGEVTPQTHPEYFHRKAELEHLVDAGWTQQEIDDRAWNEAHNQLYTDGEHVEAGKDNSDQSRFRHSASGREHSVGRSQIESPILAAQEGRGTLKDPEGLARMWNEKSHFYHRDTPEALAQSQKGINAYLKVREGYRTAGKEIPPINPKIGKAMELLGRAPTGMAATPEAMAKLDADLKAEGFRGAHDAMAKVAMSYEGLKFSRDRDPGIPQGLSGRTATRLAADAVAEEERIQP